MKKHLLLIFVLTMLFGFGAYSQNNCAAPTGFTASLHNPQWNNVLLHWDAVVDSTQEDLMWSTTTMYTRIGTNGGADFIGTVRFTPTELAGQEGRHLSSVTFVPGETQTICTYSVVVWQGGSQIDDTTFNAGTMVVNQLITSPLTVNALNTIMLDTTLPIDVTQELWIGIRCVYDTTAHPLGASNNGVVTGMGELLYIGGEWETLTESNLTDYNWLIIGHLQDPNNMITGYNLYRDNALLNHVNATSFIDSLEAGSYQYDLTATYYNNCESDPVSVSVTMTNYPCVNCQDTAIVGNGTTGNYILPLNTFYRYSFSEQIYTAEELGEINGRINCISFQYIYSSDQEKDIVVYMGNTSKNSFASSSDWIPVSQMAPVFQGIVNFTSSGENNWLNIPFDVPFEYDGSSNIVVAVLNNTGSYVSSSNNTFNTHTAPASRSLYVYQDGSVPYDVTALPSGTSSTNRNNIRFLIGDPIVCPMPSHLTITDISAHGATASWYSNDSHSGYELVLVPEGSSMADETTITVNDTFYVFENLTDFTTYNLYLRAICSSENSSWIYPVTFTTEPTCTSPINLTISQVTGTSALVTWEPAEVGATAYLISYTEAGQENWVTETVTNYQYMLTGLDPVTVYQVSVTSVCDEGTAPAATKTFTTHCLAGGEISIGDGTSTSTSIPSYSFYNYGYSQQIFMASEFNGPTDITSISVNMANLSQQRNYKIYLKHTTATDLASGWASTTGAQLVFSSPQTLVQGWNTFDFITPFSYNGTDNLLVIFIDSTGTYVSGNSWYTHSTTSSLARYMYQDGSLYPLEPSSTTSGYSLNVRNNVKFGGECDETVTCIAPNAYLSDVTSESITLNWVPGYMESSWEVEYCTDTANWISVGTVTSSPVILNNLTANTIYFVRMRSDCGGGDYSYWATMQTRTACDDIAVLPFTENFDSYGTGTNAYPSCWEKINTYSGSYPYITTTNYAGTGSLYFYAGTSGTSNIAVAPPISTDIPMNTLQANFMYRASYATDMLIVGVMTDPAYESTFVPVDTVYPASTPSDWTEQRVTFDQYTGEGNFIAFKNQYTSTYCYGYIDNLVIDLMEACPQPMHVVATSTISDTAYLSWESSGTAWDVIYGPVGFDPEDENEESTVLIQGITDNPCTITGLAGGTGYDFYVRNNCGDDGVSSWSTYPACAYPFTYVMGATGSDTVTGCGMTITDNGGPGGNYTNNCDFTLVVYPSDMDSVVTISGTFAGESSYDKLYIYDGIGTSTELAVIASTAQVSFGPFTSSSGPLTIHFHSDGSTVNAGFVAITSCEAAPTCLHPMDFASTGSTETSVTLQWIGHTETSWNIEYGPTGFTQGTGTIVAVNTNPFTVNNLTPATAYDFYVQADCGEGDVSDWVGPITETPGSYNLPTSGTYTITTCNMVIYDDGGPTGSYSSSCDVYLTIYPETTGNLISIQGTVSTESNYDYLYIYDGADANGTLLGTYCGQGLTVPVLTSTTGPLTLHFTSDGSVTYDGFELTVSCDGSGPVPTDPTVATNAASSIAQTAATLNATITNPDNVSITAKGFEWKATTGGTYTQIAGTGTGNTFMANLTGLTPNTGYTYKAFITYNGQTVYGSEMTFTTLEQGVEPCDVPTGLTAGDITGESIAISWNASANAEGYNIQYSPQGGTISSATSTTNNYTITGLTQNTTYQIQVQANCGNGNLSGWSEPITVTTTGIDNYLSNSITLYPNPSNDVVNVQCTMNNVQLKGIEVIDVYGKVVRTVVGANNYSPMQTRINVSDLAAGMYFVRVTTDAGAVTKTFVKK